MSAEEKKNYKIIFTGSVGSGKTTAINVLSDIQTVSTEEIATDETKNLKEKTTVAMDYGMLDIPNGDAVHLYGTPGQDRFNYMWDILTEGGLGLVLLVNNANKNPLKDLDYFLDVFKDFIAKTSVAIGVTNMDRASEPNIDDYQQHLSSTKHIFPIFDVDGREKRDLQILVQSLLYSIK